ncbi:MAG: acyl carrier protein [Bacteroidales bacterium]|nr:acyl carrier protein [Bacteroidales bacterium]
MSQTIESQVTEFIRSNSHADLQNLKNETLLFQEGIFDSMGFVLLIDFIEETFGIKTNDSDLVEENFESISAISGYVNRKKTEVIA